MIDRGKILARILKRRKLDNTLEISHSGWQGTRYCAVRTLADQRLPNKFYADSLSIVADEAELTPVERVGDLMDHCGPCAVFSGSTGSFAIDETLMPLFRGLSLFACDYFPAMQLVGVDDTGVVQVIAAQTTAWQGGK